MTKQEVTRPSLMGLAGGTAVAAASLALLFASSESVLRSSFQTALENRANHVEAKLPQVAEAKPPISGSEDFWLSAMRDGSAPITKAVSVGDQISFNLGGVRKTLEVSTVSDVAPQVTQIDTAASEESGSQKQFRAREKNL